MKKVIINLFLSSSHWLLKLSFFFLPIALFFAISSFLFIDNLLKSYENYLVKSYIGAQGRISIQTKNEKMIQALEKFSKENNLIFSSKSTIKANISFKNNSKIIVKYIQFIILDKEYLSKKFHQKVDSNTMFVNKVFINSFGNLDFNKFSIYLDKHIINVKYIPINTGFLGNTPTAFVSKEFAQKIFKLPKSNMIEFLENKNIELIKNEAKKLSKKYKVLEYKIYDLLNDTKSTREFFRKIKIIQNGILVILILLSLGIIVLSISILIEFKKNSLQTLHLLGMSIRDLSITISQIIFLMFIGVIFLSVLMVKVYQNIFLSISGFFDNFFIPIDIFEVVYLFVFGVLISILLFFITKYIFKGVK